MKNRKHGSEVSNAKSASSQRQPDANDPKKKAILMQVIEKTHSQTPEAEARK